MNKKKGRAKHSSKPKTWKVEKQTYSPTLKHENQIEGVRRERIIQLLSEATGWKADWFYDKPDSLILQLAQKHL